jgi:hypothetical protein
VLPLAVSGSTVIGVAVALAVALAWLLLRAETRDEAERESSERRDQ